MAMSQPPQENVITLPGTAIIFGCGHGFVLDTEATPTLNEALERSLCCPFCHTGDCLSCHGPFAGWLPTCSACEGFGTLDCWTDDALLRGYTEMRFEHGIIMVPKLGDEATEIVDWVECLALGRGDARIAERIGDEGVEVDLQLRLSEVRRLGGAGQVSVDSLLEPLIIDVCVVDCDVTPDGEREYRFIRLV